MNRIYAIGDIHGCFEKLCDLMNKIDIAPDSDVIVFLGDYIDRGLKSFEVVEYLIDIKDRFKKTIFLKGNHEEMFLNYLSGTDKLLYLMNGGEQTLESYLMHHSRGSDDPVIPQKHIDFFNSLALFYQTDDYIFVHAGLRNKIPLEMQDPKDILWIRSRFINSGYIFGKRVVFGHTPTAAPIVQPNKIGIDTGAVYGGFLTCVKLPDLLFYQA